MNFEITAKERDALRRALRDERHRLAMAILSRQNDGIDLGRLPAQHAEYHALIERLDALKSLSALTARCRRAQRYEDLTMKAGSDY